MTPSKSDRRQPLSVRLRRGVLTIHLWLGLIIGAYFSMAGLTGALLVFQDELDHLQMPELMYVAPLREHAERLSMTTLLAHVWADFPGKEGTGIFSLTLPDHPGGAYRVYLRSAPGKNPDVATIDPYTGKVIERRLYGGWPRMWHIYLMMGLRGEAISGYCGAFVAVLLLTGLWLWWPKALRQLRARLTIKCGSGAKRITHDVHNVFGIYALPLLITLSVTGLLLVFLQPFETWVYKVTHTPPGSSVSVAKPVAANMSRLSLDDLTRIATAVGPRGEPLAIVAPRKPDQPFFCFKRSSENGLLTFVRIAIDPYNGKILRMEDDRTAATGAKIISITQGLHYGQWGGLGVKTMYAVAGLIPLVLYTTGILMYFRKRWRGVQRTKIISLNSYLSNSAWKESRSSAD